MRSMTAIVLVLAFVACGGCSANGADAGTGPISSTQAPPPPPPPPAPNSYAPAAAAHATIGVALPLGKCVNLSNMLEARNEGDWGRAFQDEDAARIRQAGFATVRLPVR